MIGQETAGSGGFAMALRFVPIVLEIAAEVERHAKSDVVLLNYTNPVQIVGEAMARFSPSTNYVGLCDQTEGERAFLARLMGTERGRLGLTTGGTNHMTFTRAVSMDGEDATPAVWARLDTIPLDELVTEAERRVVRLFRILGCVPSEYMQYFLFHDEVLSDQRARGRTRAQDIMEIMPEVVESYRANADRVRPEPSMLRASEAHGDFAISVIKAMLDGTAARFVLNLANRGQIHDLPTGASVETPAIVQGRSLEALAQGGLPPEVSGLVRQVVAHAELTTEAAMTGNRALAIEALALHPLVPSIGKAESLVDAYLLAHAQFLPHFPSR